MTVIKMLDNSLKNAMIFSPDSQALLIPFSRPKGLKVVYIVELHAKSEFLLQTNRILGRFSQFNTV